MNNPILKELLDKLEQVYGDLDDDRGCYLDRKWLSVKNIVELIEEVDADY